MPEPIRIISSMATRQLLSELIAEFARESSQPVQLESVGGVDAARRVQAGEAFDIVVLASDAIEKLVEAGHLTPQSRVDLARSGVAVAVRAGAPRSDLRDGDAVRHAVLAAKTLGYSTGPSGVALARQFEHWGIAEQIKERIVQAPPGVPVGRLVAEGQVELGFQQLSELMNLPGIDVLGPLPDDIQITTRFSAAVSARSAQPHAARALLAFLAAPALDAIRRRNGMDPA